MRAHKVVCTVVVIINVLLTVSFIHAADEMRTIPASYFQMGDTAGTGNADERPVHYVRLNSFTIDRCEVSKAQWDQVRSWALTNGYTDLAEGWGGASFGPTQRYYTNHPVVQVSWYDCVKWCNARSEKEQRTPVYYTSSSLSTVYRTGMLNISNECANWNVTGYRLPTEAEWENACRGGILSNSYPWGSTLSGDKANYWYSGDPYDNGTTPVAYYNGSQVPAGTDMTNGYDLYDMIGNVQEYCWDWYDSAWYSSAGSTNDNTHGSVSGTERLVRGGCWDHGDAGYWRSANRAKANPTVAYCNLGFRTVQISEAASLVITSIPATVAYEVILLAIAGTNTGAMGMLWASNDANSLVYTFPAGQAWITPDIALEVGTNPIHVCGTSVFNTVVSDRVIITRKAATPTGLAASDGTFTNKVALAWLAAPGAAAYAVLRSDTNDVGTAAIIANAVSNTIYDDTTATPGLLYYYWLIARQNGVEGDASVPDSGYRQLQASADIAVTLGVYTNKVGISWTVVTGATKYRVYRADSPLSNLATAIAADVSTSNYTDSTATPGLVYYYWAQAESAVALGAWCGPAPGYALLAANFADKKIWAMRDTKKMDTLTCKQLPGPWSALLNDSWGLAIINVSSRAIVSGPFALVTKNGKVYTYKSPTATITYTEHYNKRKGTYKTKLVYKFAGAMPTKPGVYLQCP